MSNKQYIINLLIAEKHPKGRRHKKLIYGRWFLPSLAKSDCVLICHIGHTAVIFAEGISNSLLLQMRLKKAFLISFKALLAQEGWKTVVKKYSSVLSLITFFFSGNQLYLLFENRCLKRCLSDSVGLFCSLFLFMAISTCCYCNFTVR